MSTLVNGDTGPVVVVTAAGEALATAADAAAQRTALGLGTAATTSSGAYQPIDSDLTTIGGLSPSNDDILQRKAGAWANRTIAQLLTDLGLGALYQPLDADLTSIAALTTTAFGRAFLALADPADGTKYLDGTGAFSVPVGGLTQPQVLARGLGS